MCPSSNIEKPVLIAGGGPCGLVAALVLQNHGIPFLILEKASREKLCSNVGAGFDLAPTAVDILKNRIGLPSTEGVLCSYEGFFLMTMEGELVRDVSIPGAIADYASAHRAKVQKMLLDRLLEQANGKEESSFLKCGAAVESYEEEKDLDQVTVTLEDGSALVGRALLGCDGIHSQIRRCMYKGQDDPLQYCGVTCYWGKCDSSAPEIAAAMKETQSFLGDSFVWLLGTKTVPGSFFISPGVGHVLWVLGVASNDPPGNTNDDLTRRGGGTMTEAAKVELLASLKSNGATLAPVMEHIIVGTPASQITEAGIFDREKIDFPFSSACKLVALLGDAAHPQSPYLGQGTNCAITDAYVCATKLAEKGLNTSDAIAFYDWDHRRQGIKKLVVEARSQGKSLNSDDAFTCWILRMIFKYAPMASGLSDELKKHDNSNREFLLRLEGKEWRKKSGGSFAIMLSLGVVAVAIFFAYSKWINAN